MSDKAKHHHAKLGEALKAGDHAAAMHHTGHLFSALRHASKGAKSMPGPDMPAPMYGAPDGERGTISLKQTPPKPSGFNRDRFATIAKTKENR